MKNKKYIIITGGAGFIGSSLVRYLNECGYDRLIIVDQLGKSEKWKNLVGKRFVDIIAKDLFFEWLIGKEDKIQAIFHLGACSSTLETDASYLLENNTHYSQRLVEFALIHNIRFIYASSAATYGDGSLGFSDAEEEIEKYRPLNMYGYSKHLFDLWLKRHHLFDQVVGLKYFNVFGPNEYHKGRMSSAIVKMVPDVLSKGSIRLFKSDEPTRFGDGDQVRDFIYVKDVVQMTASFLTNKVTGIYNVGTGKAQTWNALATAVFKALDRKVAIEYIDMPDDLKGKYQNFTEADMSKWLKMGLPPTQYTLESAVIDYVRNYLLKGLSW